MFASFLKHIGSKGRGGMKSSRPEALIDGSKVEDSSVQGLGLSTLKTRNNMGVSEN